MTHEKHRPKTAQEGGFFYRNLRTVAETAGNLVLLSVAAGAAAITFVDVLHDFDDAIVHPLDSDFE